VATALLGTMVFERGISTCLVCDYSPLGARLRVSRSLLIPDSFELHLSRYGIQRKVQLRWRSNEEVGVLFHSDIGAKAR
jgi:hypothetical protein